MRKILGNEYKLNQIFTIGWLNKRGYWEVITGRIMDYSEDYICIDYSYDYQQGDDVVKIEINKIKYFHKMQNQPLWR